MTGGAHCAPPTLNRVKRMAKGLFQSMKVYIHILCFWRDCPEDVLLLAPCGGQSGELISWQDAERRQIFKNNPKVLVELLILIPAHYIWIIGKIMAAQVHTPAYELSFL